MTGGSEVAAGGDVTAKEAEMADEGAGAAPSPKTPADFLQSIKGKPVVVKLNSGVDYRGEGIGQIGPHRMEGTIPVAVHVSMTDSTCQAGRLRLTHGLIGWKICVGKIGQMRMLQ